METKIKAAEYFEKVKAAAAVFNEGAIKAYPDIPFFLYTGNADKIDEFNHFFEGSGFYFLGLKDLAPLMRKAAKLNEPPENGATLSANSIIKSSYGAGVSKIAAVADDTGFFVDRLGGEPGIYAGRYAGEPCDYEANRRLVIKNLEGCPDNERTAAFRCVITLKIPGSPEPLEFMGESRGVILKEKRPGNQFGYDPIFVPEGHQQAFSEMPLELKNKISHRGRAFQKLYDFLKESVKFS